MGAQVGSGGLKNALRVSREGPRTRVGARFSAAFPEAEAGPCVMTRPRPREVACGADYARVE